MNIESCSYKLLTGNCDVNRRLRLSELFNWFQEAAIRHTEIMGMGRTKTLDRGLLWIVIQWRVEIERLPEYDEIVTVETWPGTTMHVFFPRYFRIKDSKGNYLVQASSLWALMDQETRHVVFPEEAGIAIEGTAAQDRGSFLGTDLHRFLLRSGSERAHEQHAVFRSRSGYPVPRKTGSTAEADPV